MCYHYLCVQAASWQLSNKIILYCIVLYMFPREFKNYYCYYYYYYHHHHNLMYTTGSIVGPTLFFSLRHLTHSSLILSFETEQVTWNLFLEFDMRRWLEHGLPKFAAVRYHLRTSVCRHLAPRSGRENLANLSITQPCNKICPPEADVPTL